MSDKAIKKSKEEIREWKKENKPNCNIEEIAKNINPIIYGWINYYGKFYKSKLDHTLTAVTFRLASWAQRKYKKLHRKFKTALEWVGKIQKSQSRLFVHWS